MRTSKRMLTGALVCAALAGLLVTAPRAAKAAEKTVCAGTGYSVDNDGLKAGTEAAKKAKESLGKAEAKLVLVFGNHKGIDQAKILEGVTSVFDANIVYGCSAYNAITQYGNSGSAGVLALGGEIKVTTVLAPVEGKDFAACGKKIGEGLKEASKVKADGKFVVLIGDCHVKSNDKVVKGILGVLGEQFPVVGGAACGGITYFKGKLVGKAKNLGILITGNFQIGCSMLSKGPADVHKNEMVAAAGQAFKNAVGDDKDKTAGVFAFDCGGRRGKMGKDRPDELKVMQAVVGKDMPIIGFYGSGEMGIKDKGSPACGDGYHISACAIKTK